MLGFVKIKDYTYKFIGDPGCGTVSFDENGNIIDVKAENALSSLNYRLKSCGITLKEEGFPKRRTFAWY